MGCIWNAPSVGTVGPERDQARAGAHYRAIRPRDDLEGCAARFNRGAAGNPHAGWSGGPCERRLCGRFGGVEGPGVTPLGGWGGIAERASFEQDLNPLPSSEHVVAAIGSHGDRGCRAGKRHADHSIAIGGGSGDFPTHAREPGTVDVFGHYRHGAGSDEPLGGQRLGLYDKLLHFVVFAQPSEVVANEAWRCDAASPAKLCPTFVEIPYACVVFAWWRGVRWDNMQIGCTRNIGLMETVQFRKEPSSTVFVLLNPNDRALARCTVLSADQQSGMRIGHHIVDNCHRPDVCKCFGNIYLSEATKIQHTRLVLDARAEGFDVGSAVAIGGGAHDIAGHCCALCAKERFDLGEYGSVVGVGGLLAGGLVEVPLVAGPSRSGAGGVACDTTGMGIHCAPRPAATSNTQAVARKLGTLDGERAKQGGGRWGEHQQLARKQNDHR